MAKPKYYNPTPEARLLQRYPLIIRHIPSGEEVEFKAMITMFEDQFSSEWGTEQVLGRMDPIKTFKGTQRIVSLGWDVVAADLEEAKHNMDKCSTLMSMLYPAYDGKVEIRESKPANTATTPGSTGDKINKNSQKNVTSGGVLRFEGTGNAANIKAAPLFKVKFANLINAADGVVTSKDVNQNGLLGSIDGLTYAPDIEQDFFTDRETGTELYPQTLRLSFALTVAHTHPLGWEFNSSGSRTPDNQFPYKKVGK
jgi:hypothetical protein